MHCTAWPGFALLSWNTAISNSSIVRLCAAANWISNIHYAANSPVTADDLFLQTTSATDVSATTVYVPSVLGDNEWTLTKYMRKL